MKGKKARFNHHARDKPTHPDPYPNLMLPKNFKEYRSYGAHNLLSTNPYEGRAKACMTQKSTEEARIVILARDTL